MLITDGLGSVPLNDAYLIRVAGTPVVELTLSIVPVLFGGAGANGPVQFLIKPSRAFPMMVPAVFGKTLAFSVSEIRTSHMMRSLLSVSTPLAPMVLCEELIDLLA
jgi:hypothetical protein